MADRYAEAHPAAAVGAMRLARETHTQYIQLLMALGKLPQNLELFRSEAMMQRIAEEMVEKLEAFVRGEVEAAELLVFFRTLLPEQPTVPQLTA
jgi:predicted methyltransferase MtxX (methanogen marker protein 4)